MYDYDIIITNGEVIDGSGSSSVYKDVGIIGNKIHKIGNLSSAESEIYIDAEGLVVSPGFIDAGMSAPHYRDDAERKKREAMVPMQRIGTANDIAKVVMFLLSDDSSYVHGENILVDGGVMNSVLANIGRG